MSVAARLAIAALLALGACGQRPEPAAITEASPTAPVAAPTPHPAPPPPPFFVGRWAASLELCTGGAWTIGERELSTAGEVHCRFERTTAVAAGFEVEAVCTAEGPPTAHRPPPALRLRPVRPGAADRRRPVRRRRVDPLRNGRGRLRFTAVGIAVEVEGRWPCFRTTTGAAWTSSSGERWSCTPRRRHHRQRAGVLPDSGRRARRPHA